MIDFSLFLNILSRFSAVVPSTCPGASGLANFLNFPTWWEFLPSMPDANNICAPAVTGLNDVWLIVAAVTDILLRIAAIAAVSMIVYGGFQFVTSNGNSDQANKAKTTVLNALIGLVIAVSASVVIRFVAGGFSAS